MSDDVIQQAAHAARAEAEWRWPDKANETFTRFLLREEFVAGAEWATGGER